MTGKDCSDCAAPHLGAERQTAANGKSRRFGRRGPRSVEAVQRRADRFAQRRLGSDKANSSKCNRCQRSSPEEVGGKAPTSSPDVIVAHLQIAAAFLSYVDQM